MATSWQDTAATFQAERLAKIPKEWLVPASLLAAQPRNVLPLFAACGVLTERELAITGVADATTLLAQIHARAWTATEVAVAFCKRAAVAQQLVNCLMDMDFEGGIRRARELDAHLEKTGQVVGPLHGLPVSIKDLTQVKDMLITNAYVCNARQVAPQDAVVVQTLREAGAVIYVKTTMPQTGMALETNSNLYGRTLNPFNGALVSGGSSGGEAALNACLGAAVGVATDIGGSIRAPAAFNGLYGVRPTSRRFSYMGNNMAFSGQTAVLSSIGPVGRSLRDVELVLKVWSAWQPWLVDPAVMAKPWASVAVPAKATIGVMAWDGVVMPHPPIQRALKETVAKLKAAGHEVVEVEPYKNKYAWELAVKQYAPTGATEVCALLAKSGEPPVPAIEKFFVQVSTPTPTEQVQHNRDQRAYQTEYLAHWNATAARTTSGKPIDALLTPSMASASFPHDFLPWWGYLAQWNLLDYPCFILPVSMVGAADVADPTYEPVSALDKENWDLYDPEVFADAPVCLQLVGRSMMEEELLAVAMAVDKAVKG